MIWGRVIINEFFLIVYQVVLIIYNVAWLGDYTEKNILSKPTKRVNKNGTKQYFVTQSNIFDYRKINIVLSLNHQ